MKRSFTLSGISALAALAGFNLVAQPRYSAWTAPVNLGPLINTAYNEQHPALSKDGLSNRPGGYGADNLWVSQRASVNDTWGTPQNLGPVINTGAIEFSPTFSLPVLSEAKAQGQSTACLSNIKQLQISWPIYVDDHEDGLVPNKDADDNPLLSSQI